MFARIGMTLLIALALSACGDDAPNPKPVVDDPCETLTCGANESCSVTDDTASCVCDVGFKRDGEVCVAEEPEPEPNACDPNPCEEAGRTTCLLDPTTQDAVCVCDTGLREEDGVCVPAVDLCEEFACTAPNRGVCAVVDGAATCLCNEGYNDEAGECVAPAGSPCEVNPCTAPNQTTCVAEGDVATCQCNTGYIDVNGTCELPNPCDSTTCAAPNKSVCVVDGGQGVCICDEGFTEVNGACIVPNPCDANPCPDASMTCTPDAGQPVCTCPVGEILVNDTCTLPDPCDPNPCMDANRTVCSVSGTAAVCSCDAGYVDQAGVCVVDLPPACGTPQPGGDVYEPNDCPQLATQLTPGQQQLHTIHVGGDNDWFKFTAEAGRIYQFTLTRGTLTDAYVYLYDTDGTTALISRDGPEYIKYRFEQAGTYYFRVRHYSSNQTGSYSILLTDEGVDDHGDSAAEATPILPNGQGVAGEIETTNDNDWFSFTAQAGRIYTFDLTRGTLSDAYIWLYAPDGTSSLLGRDGPEFITYRFDQAGTYYFRVRHYNTSSASAIGTYTVTLTDEGTDDHGNSATEATPILPNGQAVAGEIETTNDNDWFSFTAVAGQIYTFELTRGTLSDAYIWLYDTDGTTSLLGRDGPEFITYRFEQAGTYYFRVRHYNTTSAFAVGTYTVSLTDEGTDDHGNSATEATPILPNGQEVAGEIETTNDNDWFSFTAQAGRIYTFDLTRGNLSDAYIWLYDTDGTTLLLGRDSPEFIKYEFDQSGTYYFRVRHYNTTSAYAVGTYTVTLTDNGTDDHGDNVASATPIQADSQPVAGEIETTNDRDYFSFTAVPGRIYELTGVSLTLGNMYIYLVDDSGSIISSRTSAGSIRYRFDQGGTYAWYVRHSSTTSAFGVGTYTVALTDLGTDDHGDTPAAATPIVVDAAPTAGEIETPNDWDFFSVELQGGSTYRVDSTGLNVQKHVYSDPNTLLTSSSNASFTFTAPQSGTYYIRVRHASTSIGAYTIQITD